MSEQERDRRKEQDEPDVEGHRHKAAAYSPDEQSEGEAGRRESEDPDFEAHRHKA